MVFQQIRRLFITLDASDQATRKLQGVNQMANASSASMQAAAAQASVLRRRLVAAGFGAAVLTGAMAKMVGQVAQVERQFAIIEGTSGATVEQMQRIRNEVSRIGAEMPVRINEAAEAFKQLSFAGLEAEESIEAAQGVTELAVAGNMQMGQAANLSARAMNALGLEANELDQVMQSLSATFTNSATNMRELSQAMEYVLPSARQTGQTVTDLTAALGVLSDNALSGSKAGTSLERVLRKLAQQTGRTQDAMNQLGVTMDDLTTEGGDFMRMSRLVQVLDNNMQDMEGVEQLKALSDMFGARGARAANILINNTEEFNRKVGDNARAQINATMRSLDDLNNDQLQGINETLNTAIENTAMFREGFRFEITQDTSTMEVVEDLNAAADEMSEEQLVTAINTAFSGIGVRSAEVFASDLKDANTSVEAMTESINSMTTQGDLAQEQMESLWGQIEYLRGSLDSIVMQMVSGMKPALDAFFAVAKLLVNTLNEYPSVARGIGAAMAALNAVMIALIGNTLYLLATNSAVIAQMKQTAVWSAINTARTKARAIATGQLTLAQIRQRAVELASVAAKKAMVAANMVAITSTLALGNATRYEAMQQALGNNHRRLATLLKWKDTAASWAATAAQWAYNTATSAGTGVTTALAGALSLATVAMVAEQVAAYGAAVATYVFYNVLTGGLINVVYALVAAIGALVAALGAIMVFDIGGWGDEAGNVFDALVSPITATIDVIAWLVELIVQLLSLGLDAAIWSITVAAKWLSARLGDLADAFMETITLGGMLGDTGKMLEGVTLDLRRAVELLAIAVLMIINPVVGIIALTAWLIQNVEALNKAWFALGAALGAALKTLKPVLDIIVAIGEMLILTVQILFNAVVIIVKFAAALALLPFAMLFEGLKMLVYGITDFLGITEEVNAAIGWFVDICWAAVDAVAGFFGLIGGALIGALEWLADGFQWVVDQMKLFNNFLKEAANMSIAEMLYAIVDGIFGIGGAIVDAIIGGLAGLGGMLIDAIVGAFAGLIPFMPGSDASKGPLSNLTDWGMGIIKTIVDGILAVPGMIIGAIKDILLGIPGAIAGAVAGIGGAIVDGIAGAISGAAGMIGDAIGGAVNAAKGAVGGAINMGKDLVGGVVDGVKGAAGAAGDAINKAVTDPVGAAQDAVGMGEDLMKGLGDGIKGATDMVADAVSGVPILGDTAQLANSAINKSVDLGKKAIGGLADGIKGAMGMVGDAAGKVGGMLDNATGGLLGDAFDSGKSFVKDFAGGVKGAADTVGDAAKGAMDKAASMIPFSPAEKGPLSDLGKSGPGFINTLADGILGEKGKLRSAVGSAMDSAKKVMGAKGPAGKALTMGQEIAGGLAGGMKKGMSAVKGAAGTLFGAAEKTLGGVADSVGLGSEFDAVANTVKGVAGQFNQASNAAMGATGMAAPTAAGGAAAVAGKRKKKAQRQQQQTQIIFKGEVHDADKVDEKVRKGMKQAKRESNQTIEDDLEMNREQPDQASESASNITGSDLER